MPHPFHFARRRQGRRPPAVVAAIGRETLAALVLAAGVVARADGQADPAERRALFAFLRKRGLLARHGRAAVLGWYDAAVGAPDGRDLAGAVEDLRPLERLAGTASAPVIAAAARHVAMADGVEWPQETALLGVIGERLGLRPQRAPA